MNPLRAAAGWAAKAACLGAAVLAALATANGSVAAASSSAGPDHDWRGVIEGAYGPTWSHLERTRVIRKLSNYGFNAYVHAPKDDLYQRTNWRDPYPAAQQQDFEREIRASLRLGVEWIPNLSPALPLIPTPAVPQQLPSRDLCFSCPADLGVVVEKLRPFLEAGTRTVMISFDDVTKTMSHPQDLVGYGVGDGAFGRANGDFLTRLDERLDEEFGSVEVLTVGADYAGTADTAYLGGLRSALDDSIGVMWTGTGVPAEPWTDQDAAAYGEAIGRTPLVWDNWTNNDTAGNATPAGTARIFLGPYIREPESALAVDGFFFNAANEADLNLLPLATAGDLLDAPYQYRANASWLGAVRHLAPGRSPAARARRASFRAWAETNWSNKLDREREAPTFTRLSGQFLARYGSGGAWARARKQLGKELGLVLRAPERVAQLPDAAIAEQAADFLANAATTARAGMLGTALLAAERPRLALGEIGERGPRPIHGRALPPDPDAANALRSEMQSAEIAATADTVFTYGWRVPIAFEIPPYPVPDNTMSVYLNSVRSLDRAWQPKAEAAASEVAVELDGNPVLLDADGSFALGRDACGRRLLAVDGAGGRRALTVRCAPARMPAR